MNQHLYSALAIAIIPWQSAHTMEISSVSDSKKPKPLTIPELKALARSEKPIMRKPIKKDEVLFKWLAMKPKNMAQLFENYEDQSLKKLIQSYSPILSPEERKNIYTAFFGKEYPEQKPSIDTLLKKYKIAKRRDHQNNKNSVRFGTFDTKKCLALAGSSSLFFCISCSLAYKAYHSVLCPTKIVNTTVLGLCLIDLANVVVDGAGSVASLVLGSLMLKKANMPQIAKKLYNLFKK